MRSRSGALKASSAMQSQTPRSYSRSRAPAKARCSSSSAGKLLLPFQNALGVRRLLEQHGKRRYLSVPFDQRRARPEERDRLGIQRPHLGRDARAVIVDADRAAVFELAHTMSREMELAKRLRRQRAQVGDGVEAVIARAHVNVVDVAQ